MDCNWEDREAGVLLYDLGFGAGFGIGDEPVWEWRYIHPELTASFLILRRSEAIKASCEFRAGKRG